MKTSADQWIFLRGLARHSGHWLGFPERLCEKLAVPPISVDLPGTGTRFREKSPRSIHELVEHARAAAPSTSGRRYIVGVSLGGMIAMDWAAIHPQEVAGIVVINSSAGGLSPVAERLQPAAMKALGLAGLESLRNREIRALSVVSNRSLEGKALDEWIALSQNFPMSRRNAARQLIAAGLFRLPPKPKTPVLILTSEGDRLCSPQCSRAIAQRWNVPLKTHPWAGHDLTHDDPDWVVNEILAWHSTSR